MLHITEVIYDQIIAFKIKIIYLYFDSIHVNIHKRIILHSHYKSPILFIGIFLNEGRIFDASKYVISNTLPMEIPSER